MEGKPNRTHPKFNGSRQRVKTLLERYDCGPVVEQPEHIAEYATEIWRAQPCPMS
jgi:hypothetical protein